MMINPASTKNVLHLSNHSPSLDNSTSVSFAGWQNERATFNDLHRKTADSVDAVFSSHGIEQLYAHQVIDVLQQCLRVLKPKGFLLLQCVDLKSAATLITSGNYTNPVYKSPQGMMAAIDIIYGHRPSIAAGHTDLAHHCGFTGHSLIATLKESGFIQIAAREIPNQFELWALATKQKWEDRDLKTTVSSLFPKSSPNT